MTEISIISATFSGNRGAEAMLVTTIRKLREKFPDAIFNVFSYYCREDKEIVNEIYINIYDFSPTYLLLIIIPFSIIVYLLKLLRVRTLPNYVPQSVAALFYSKVIIDLSGVSFIDGREKFLPYNILTLLPGFMFGVPVVKFSQALGPFKGFANRIAARTILSKCARIFGRGQETIKHLQKLNIDNIIFDMAGDIAFLHEIGYSFSKENVKFCLSLFKTLNFQNSRNHLTIGICVSSLVDEQSKKYNVSYREVLSKFVMEMYNKGHTIILFPNAVREQKLNKKRNNDLPIILYLQEQLKKINRNGKIIFVDKNINADIIKICINYCDIVITSRFHAMVFALSLAKPVIVLGWSHKYYEVMTKFGLKKWSLDFKEMDVIRLTEIVYQMILVRKKLIAKIIESLEVEKRLSEKQLNFIDNVLRP